MDLFISHSTADDKIVSQIYEKLEAAGLSVWVDHEDGIGPGDQWPMQIQEAANTCKAGLFVMSVKSVQSPYCTAEWQRILDRGMRLYLLLIEDTLEQVPLRLGIIQYIDLRQRFEEGLGQLIAALKGERALDTQSAYVGQIRRLSGTFPHSALDLPLMGRAKELAAVRAALANGNRLTAILGLGGVGKTRLAAEIASAANFRDGVVWHSISPESSLMHLTPLIREHLRLDESVSEETVWQSLGQKQLLLVLDNAEDCRQPAAYAERIQRIDLSGGTRVLMTSRHQWPELRGKSFDLRVPDLEAAVQILRAMTGKEAPAFSPEGHEAALAKAARQHPRLMEYAVRWLDSYPPDYVLELLRTLEGADVEEILNNIVHKTVAQVRSQEGGAVAITALRRLSVCRGGFTFEAAHALIDDPRALATLRQWGLVSLDEGRYDIDPLVIKAVGRDESACEAHFAYYETLAQEQDSKQDYFGLDSESANLEAAFEWAMRVDEFEKAYWFANTCSAFLVNRGRYQQRAEWMIRLKETLGENPDLELRSAFQNSLGTAYSALSEVEEREANLRRAIAAYTAALDYYRPQVAPLDYAMTQNNLGNAYSALSEVEEREVNLRRAIAAYTAALEYQTPQVAPLAYAMTQNNLGNAYRDLSAVEEREVNLRRAIAAYTAALDYYRPQVAPLDYAMTQNNLGNAYRDLSAVEEREVNLRRAIAAYTAALEYQTPQVAPLAYAMTQNNLGNAYRDLSAVEEREVNLRRAIAAYTAALEYRRPQVAPLDYAMTQNNLGTAYSALSEVEEREVNLRRAIAAYTAALDYYRPQVAPLDYAMTQNNLGTAYRDLSEVEEREGHLRWAIAAYTAALEVQPQHSWALTRRGQVYRSLQHYDAALADFNRAIELDPESDWKLAERGETYRLMGRHNEALTDFNHAIELDPKYLWALASRGQLYQDTGRYNEALEDFSQAVELDPNYGWALTRRGQVYRSLQHYDAALADFNHALELDPRSDWKLAERGELLRLMGRFEAALTDFTQALELDPQYVWALIQRGQTYHGMQRYDEALADFNTALGLASDYTWAYICRADTYSLMNRFEEAEADYSRAIELEANAAYTLRNRAGFYLDFDRLNEAEADLNQAAEAQPDAAYLHYHRARLSVLRGEPALALTLAQRALERDDSLLLAHIPVALAHLLLDNLDAAAASVRTFISETKDFSDLQMAIQVVKRFLANRPDLSKGQELLAQLREAAQAAVDD